MAIEVKNRAIKPREKIFEKAIECPYCGYQYMLADIIIPDFYFGKAKEIERDYAGKIINKIGYRPPTHQWKYNCDKCFRDFELRVICSWSTVIIPFEEAHDNCEWSSTSLTEEEK